MKLWITTVIIVALKTGINSFLAHFQKVDMLHSKEGQKEMGRGIIIHFIRQSQHFYSSACMHVQANISSVVWEIHSNTFSF